MREYPKEVEDFTNPFLVMAGLLLFVAFIAMTMTMGLVSVILTGALGEAAYQYRMDRLRTEKSRQPALRAKT